MSDLSPQSRPKRTLIRSLSPLTRPHRWSVHEGRTCRPGPFARRRERHRAHRREHAPHAPWAGATLDHVHASALSGGMIALTDAGLSCLIEAAKVIEPRARHRWLQNLADELDPSPNARRRARWRRWYHNDKAGVATVRVRYSGVGLANLIIGGWLRAHDEAYTDEEISKAIGSLIEYGNLPRKPNAIG